MTGQRLDPEQAVRDWLSDSAPDRVPASLRETLKDVTSRPAGHARPSPRFARRRLLMAGRFAAALAMLAIVASGAYLYGSSRTATPSSVISFASTSPATQASVSPSAGPSASPSASPSLQSTVTQLPGSSWRLVSGALPQMVASSWGSFRSPIFSLPGDGFLAFVPSAGTATPTSWTTRVFQSTDGVSWSERSILPSDAARVTALAEADGQMVAVGCTGDIPNETALAWTSSDLQSWRATELSRGTIASGVTVGPAGFLAWGLGENGTNLWSSTDGLAWQSVTTSGLPENFLPDDFFGTAGGWEIAAMLTDREAVWQSSDGSNWRQTWTGPGMSGLTSFLLGSIVRTQDGSYVSFGWAYTGTGLVDPGQELLIWTSRDGATWTLSDRIKPPGRTDGFAALPGGYVAAGAQPAAADAGVAPLGSLGVWTSPDGRTWQPLTGLPSVGPIEVLSVVGDGAHAVIVCVDQAGDIQLLVGDGLQ